MKKIIIGLMATVLVAGGVLFANSQTKKDCCDKNSACCFPGSACCARK